MNKWDFKWEILLQISEKYYLHHFDAFIVTENDIFKKWKQSLIKKIKNISFQPSTYSPRLMKMLVHKWKYKRNGVRKIYRTRIQRIVKKS